MRPGLGLWLLVSVVATGCASASDRHAGANPFVKGGKPALEMGEPLKPPKVAKEPKGSRRQPPDVRRSANVLPTIESTDRVLSAALLRLAVFGTPANHRAVADRYREVGILDMAFEHYSRAAALDRADAAAYEGLARIWRDWGFPGLGVADASRAVYYAPDSASAHNTLGTVLAAVGHDDAARREYERSVQLDPGAAYAWNNLCSLSFRAGDAVAAAGECEMALSLDPRLSAARQTVAALERTGARERVP
jgi:tetratricopeptide (TPR) repeat protein